MDSGDFPSTFNLSMSSENSILEWYQCTPEVFVFLVPEMFNTLLGLFTNIWMLVLILGDWRNQALQEIFTINLGMLEILYCILSQVLMLNYMVLKIPFINKCIWSVYGISFFGRSVFQCGMSVERYVAVVHPVFFFKHQFLNCKVIFVITGWFITASFILTINIYVEIYPVAGLFTVVVSVNLFCTFSILRVLRRPSPGAREGKKVEEMNGKKKRASNTVMIIQASVMFNYIPLFIALLLKHRLPLYIFMCLYQPVGFSFCLMGSFLQPLIFLHHSGKL